MRDRDEDRGSRRRDDEDRDSRRSRDRDEEPRRRSRDDDEPSRRSRDEDEEPRSRRSRDEDEDRGSRRRSRDEDEDRGSSRRSGSGFSYRERSADSTKKRASMGNNDFDKFLKDGVKMWKPNDGDNRIRIVPPTWEEADHYGLDIYMHYGIGPDRQSYLCLNKMKGEACPICEEREQLKRDGDDEAAKEIEPKRRVLIYLVDRDHPKEGLQAYAMPWTLDRDIVKVSQDKSTGEVLQIDHPEHGYDVEFEKKGSKNRTEYLGVAIARRESSLGKESLLDDAVDAPLSEQLIYFSYDHIAKAFGGHGQQRDRRRDEDEEPPRNRSRDRDDDSRSSRRSRDEEEERPRRRERDEDEGRSSRRKESDDPTWESVHEMTRTELEDLIEVERLDIKPRDAKDTEDLADWVCEEMKLKKSEAPKRRKLEDDPEEDDKLAEMRRRRRD